MARFVVLVNVIPESHPSLSPGAVFPVSLFIDVGKCVIVNCAKVSYFSQGLSTNCVQPTRGWILLMLVSSIYSNQYGSK